MSSIAISCEGISKRYRLGRRRKGYRTLRDTLADAATNSIRKLRTSLNNDSTGDGTFWALKDVTFEIERGEVVGVIGRNGAGKSTLLKILSRITEPTAGRALINGRVGALLEVGTGFHPELSGRENIMLNGSILGMKRSEILDQFDQIVAFAEVEEFIDTSVKHYSSGMYLRLAFSVAAHLQPEILLVDEVLAVGDAAFQRKCLGKMEEVANEGRTVLFVSHNMSAVQELCRRAILIDRGQVVYQGLPANCVAEYYRRLDEKPVVADPQSTLLSIGRINVESPLPSGIACDQPFKISIPVIANNLRNPWIYLIVEDFTGRMLIHKRISSREINFETLDGEFKVEVEIPTLWLSPGVYSAYFKFLIPSVASGSGRVISDKFLLEARGELDPTGRAALNPDVIWRIDA